MSNRGHRPSEWTWYDTLTTPFALDHVGPSPDGEVWVGLALVAWILWSTDFMPLRLHWFWIQAVYEYFLG